jgi:tryptophan synthase beta chain
MEKRTKFILDEEEIPKYWYNIQADLPELLPPILHSRTRNPVTADDTSQLFHMHNF